MTHILELFVNDEKIDSNANDNKPDSERFNLKVAESNINEVGKRIARIDPKVAIEYGINTGDALEVSSKNLRTIVLNRPSSDEDFGKGLIRIDGHERKKLKAGINDIVSVKKIKISEAKSITLAPTEPLRISEAEPYLLSILEGQIVTRTDIVPIGIMGQVIHFVVISTDPPGESALITNQTKIIISQEVAQQASEKKLNPKIPGFLKRFVSSLGEKNHPKTNFKSSQQIKLKSITYEDVGGLKDEVRKVREIIELPLRHPELFKRLGVKAPKGVLLHGPPGTGKTLLAKAIASETNANFYTLSGPEIMSKFYGESEERLRSIFQQADQSAPAIIFIDELDSIASKREDVTGEVERRIVAQLLSLMDGLSSLGEVVVIGATNRVNAIDPALRRPGRFDREIELGVPDRNGRLEILQIHTTHMPLDKDVNLAKIADITHGFVGADLQSLTKEAAMHALRKVLPNIDLSKDIPIKTIQEIVVKMDDFTEVLKEIEPSAMREVFVEIPDVTWKDVGGLNNVKEELLQAIEWPLTYKGLFAKSKIKAPKGIFLYGPPGTGKTLIAKAVANESQSNFISIKGPKLLSKWVGESEKGVREVFRKARQAAPCIIFFDEIDSIAPVRGGEFGDSHVTERIISQMLTELDGLEELRGVIVLAATNRPDMIDPALLRSGRFDRVIYIPPPDIESRLLIFRIHTREMQLDVDVNLSHLAEVSNGYTGADIALVVSTAALMALKDHLLKYPNPEEAEKKSDEMKVRLKHFEESMQKIRPLSTQELEWYKKLSDKFERDTRAMRLTDTLTRGIA